ncbi:hypothetical protein [Viridibacillus sp. FSL H8-0110]|uniref:hypothetical protein n=1 Tax=Viridibacillus sp. FSL H8-0110 TaxID=2921376 RepID=UPI0030FC2B24
MTKENIVNDNTNEVEAMAQVSVTLAKGNKSANSARVNLLTGFASISVKHTSGTGVLGVEIVNPTGIDEAVKTWYLNPGESYNSSMVSLPKETYYLRLSSYSQNAGGTGTLAPSTIIA